MTPVLLGRGSALFPDGLGGVVFDCDGVIIDSWAANAEFYNRVRAYFGLPPMTPEMEAFAFMASAQESLEHVVPPEHHAEIPHVTRNVVSYGRDIVPLLRLQPGFREMADELRSWGLRLGVHTNRTRPGMQTVLDIFDLGTYFQPVITVTEAAPKPSPEGVSLILDEWNLAPGQALFVGDSSHDRAAAAAAGAVFAAFAADDLRGDLTADGCPGLLQTLRKALEV